MIWSGEIASDSDLGVCLDSLIINCPLSSLFEARVSVRAPRLERGQSQRTYPNFLSAQRCRRRGRDGRSRNGSQVDLNSVGEGHLDHQLNGNHT